LINRVQMRVPLTRRPFAALAEELGSTEDEILCRMRRLWDLGIVRRLGPIVNYAAWGMSGALVAAKLAPERVEAARAAVGEFAEITHAYLRDHAWNLWFTVIAEDEPKRDAIVARVAARAGLSEVRILPKGKSFKLGVRFEL
jgi:DNA-binding Lrp family transcriptional regulator